MRETTAIKPTTEQMDVATLAEVDRAAPKLGEASLSTSAIPIVDACWSVPELVVEGDGLSVAVTVRDSEPTVPSCLMWHDSLPSATWVACKSLQ